MQDQAKKSGAGIRGGRMLATFANAITCHKSQGSQWESVYVVDETPAMISMTIRREGAAAAVEQARQWMYTAVSRASESVTVTAARRV
jgi:exodeoxyribonuclease-5